MLLVYKQYAVMLAKEPDEQTVITSQCLDLATSAVRGLEILHGSINLVFLHDVGISCISNLGLTISQESRQVSCF